MTLPLIAITCGQYASPCKLVDAASALYNCPVFEDVEVIQAAARGHGLKKELIFKAVQGRHIPFDNFTHDRKKCMAALKVQITDCICKGPCIFSGILSHLIQSPEPVFYRILSDTPRQYRVKQAREKDKLSGQEAMAAITKADRRTQRFADLLGLPSLYEPGLHNLALDWQKADKESFDLTESQLKSTLEKIQADLNASIFTSKNKETVFDLNTSARVEFALAELGHCLVIESHSGHILVTLDRKVMNLSKAQQEITDLARVVPGVKSVKTKIGPNYYKGGITRNFDFGAPFRRKSKDP